MGKIFKLDSYIGLYLYVSQTQSYGGGKKHLPSRRVDSKYNTIPVI